MNEGVDAGIVDVVYVEVDQRLDEEVARVSEKTLLIQEVLGLMKGLIKGLWGLKEEQQGGARRVARSGKMVLKGLPGVDEAYLLFLQTRLKVCV